ncbi:hypothetical protein ITX31_02140 [Arthrobacter gandavensis]|uniref:hypothetical protein n=1 Tax=Arthrobacter gandavensis TaxID=169960 RepID=UPI00188E9A29|nr:hypothetical protein [Arthrobacter gandavensis]MBF4992909.1 hypothetical protein [Arthrobacter gandavensis]
MEPELILAADADVYGGGRHSLAARCRKGRIVRLRAGVYVDAESWHALAPWERERLRIRAAVAQGSLPRVPVQESAAIMWGLPVLSLPPEVLILADGPSHGRRRAGIRWTVRNLLEPLASASGLTVTSRAQTVLDMAAYLEFEAAVPAMDKVLRSEPPTGLPGISKEHLLRLAENLPNRTRLTRAVHVIGFADARSESAGESYSRAVMRRRGFPPPELQREFITAEGRFRTDFFWPERNLVGEFDGALKYGGDKSVAGPQWDILLKEKRREDAIRATGVGFVRWSWADISRPAHHPGSLVRRLLQAGLPLQEPSRRRRD